MPQQRYPHLQRKARVVESADKNPTTAKQRPVPVSIPSQWLERGGKGPGVASAENEPRSPDQQPSKKSVKQKSLNWGDDISSDEDFSTEQKPEIKVLVEREANDKDIMTKQIQLLQDTPAILKKSLEGALLRIRAEEEKVRNESRARALLKAEALAQKMAQRTSAEIRDDGDVKVRIAIKEENIPSSTTVTVEKSKSILPTKTKSFGMERNPTKSVVPEVIKSVERTHSSESKSDARSKTNSNHVFILKEDAPNPFHWKRPVSPPSASQNLENQMESITITMQSVQINQNASLECVSIESSEVNKEAELSQKNEGCKSGLFPRHAGRKYRRRGPMNRPAIE